MTKYSIEELIDQGVEVLVDRSRTGKIIPWAEKAGYKEDLALFYESMGDELSMNKAIRLRECASWLKFEDAGGSNVRRLVDARFCRIRLCPMCVHRKTRKLGYQMSRVMEVLAKEDKYAYIFGTLTLRNCLGEQLSETLDLVMGAWNKFVHLDELKFVRGYYRGVEVTHNVNRESEWFDSFHPHVHFLFAVNKSYFTDKTYLSKNKWRTLWQRCLGSDYLPEVKVNRVKGNTACAVAEITKYAVKESEYIKPEDYEMSLKTIRILDNALRGRRFVAFGGVIRKVRKQLKQDDVETGNLIKSDQENGGLSEEEMPTKTYAWNVGYRQYVRRDERLE